ncbi:MAG: hypothetical protein ACQERD_06960 [Campylobacterota bacterium]
MKFGISEKPKVVFCDKDYTHKQTNSKVDIILSPQFYWVRKFNLPAKNRNEALKLLPAMFEEYIPQGSYDYFCVKLQENSFLCFAYENEKILNFLKKANFNISKINKVRFAQTEFLSFEDSSLHFNNKNYIYNNGIMLMVPFETRYENSHDINKILQDIKLSKNSVNFKFYNSVLDKKTIITLCIMIFIIALVNFYKNYQLQEEAKLLEANKQELKKKYDLPQTSFQLEAILKDLKTTNTNQTNLKETLSQLLKYYKVSTKVKLDNLTVNSNTIQARFEGDNLNRVKKYYEDNYKDIKTRYYQRKLIMDIPYE